MPINTGPRIPTAADWAEKQITRTQAAGDAWQKGMNAPKKDPVAAAIAAKDKYNNSMQKVIQEDRFAKGLMQVDSQSIADSVNALGPQVFTNGVAARAPKIRRKVAMVREKLTVHVDTMDALPTATPEQREAKMIANLRGMRKIGDDLKGV